MKVGPIRDAAEESEEEEDEEEEEDAPKKTRSPLGKVFNKVLSPLKSISKRKATELSPGSVKDVEAESNQRARGCQLSPALSIEVPIPSKGTSPYYSTSMPPPSIVSSRSAAPQDPFYVQRLENQLRESQEDLSLMQEGILRLEHRYASRQSLLLEDISHLRTRLGEGKGSRRGGSSGGRGGAGSSSGRF